MLLSSRKELVSGFGWGVAVFLLGIAVGGFARSSRWWTERAAREGGVFAAQVAVADESAPPLAAGDRHNGLEVLCIELSPTSRRTLEERRERALERGVILQEEGDLVPARVGLGTATHPASVRLKGDWLDHVRADRWSLRIELEQGQLFGMRAFSIQAPETKGWLWEWLYLAAARREGLLAPRGSFVNVVINGDDAGIYYLEEHFRKEMLESQGRREGPIVRWDEDMHWRTLLHAKAVGEPGSRLLAPTSNTPALIADTARVRAYGEKRLASIESLSRSLFSAVEKMRGLRALAVEKHEQGERLRVLQDLAAARGAAIDELLDVERLACSHGLASLFQVKHGLGWHQLRFYHDPLSERLEPILFDNMPHVASDPAPVPLRADSLVQAFSDSHAYYEGVFRYVGLYCEPTWVDRLFDALEPELSIYADALRSAGDLPLQHDVAAMRQRLRAQQTYLRRVLFPPQPIALRAWYDPRLAPDGRLALHLEVTAWATTKAPVVVEGFRFHEGGLVSARHSLVAEESWFSASEGGGIVLPNDDVQATFRFLADERLATLESVGQLKDALRQGEARGGLRAPEVSMVYRSLGSAEPREMPIGFRLRREEWLAEGGRPAAPSIATALARHPFLDYRFDSDELVVRAGTWEVEGDLVVPSGTTLRVSAGTRLLFGSGHVLLSETPLSFEGTPQAPIVLAPRAGAASFGGVAVIEARARSRWRFVTVQGARSVARAGWTTTGGVSFYRSPVTLEDCAFEDSLAEDALNVFGADVSMRRVSIRRAASDGFDGDFITGELLDCVFEDCAADGADFSGSDVELRGVVARRIGDKALSVGEASRVEIHGALLQDVAFGVVAKDGSQVLLEDSRIEAASRASLAAFVKKTEFGAPSVTARNVDLGSGDVLVQLGSLVEVDGNPVEGQPLDVAALYRKDG